MRVLDERLTCRHCARQQDRRVVAYAADEGYRVCLTYGSCDEGVTEWLAAAEESIDALGYRQVEQERRRCQLLQRLRPAVAPPFVLVAFQRDARLLAVIDETLRVQHPFFEIDPGTPNIEISSPQAFAGWVFRHPRARIETVKIRRWSGITRRYHTVASASAVRITADRDTSDRDSMSARIEPGLHLLPSGAFWNHGAHDDNYYDKKVFDRLINQPPDRIESGYITKIASALDIPFAIVRLRFSVCDVG